MRVPRIMRVPRMPLILLFILLCCSSVTSAHKGASSHAALNAALLVAAAKGNAAQVKRLLSAGADVDTRRGYDARSAVDMTPLMLAATGIRVGDNNQQRLDTVKALLAHGANINASSEGGFTPLIWAAWANNERVVRLLIHRGADVNANYPSDYTPLAVATRVKARRVARLLLRAGAKESPPSTMPMQP